MAKEHVVKIRLEGDSTDAEQSVKGAQRRLGELGKETKKLKKDFDRGDKSAEDFTKSLDKLDAEAAELRKGLKEVGASTEGTTSAFRKFSGAIKDNAAAIASATAILYGAARAMVAVARAAFDSETAVRKMEASMKTAGDFSREASEDMQAFAKGLQSVGTESDESILKMVALAKGFVGTNEAAKKLVATALDFKEIAAIAFEESVRRIGRATGGSVEDIAKFDSRILELTKTQLANGEATRLLGEKYKGLNKEMSETAEGGLTKLENIFQDLQAAFGQGVISASNFSGAVTDLTATLEGQVGTAERLGTLLTIYFAELVKGFDHSRAAVKVFRELGDATRDGAEANREAAKAARDKAFADEHAAFKAKLSKEEQAALTEALKAQAAAYVKAIASAAAFGEVTSVQLEAQIIKIIQALEDQRRILGESSVEYQRLADVAGGKIESLRGRIESLRDGLGDLKDRTVEVSGAMGEYARDVDTASTATARHTNLVIADTRALDSQAAAASRSGRTQLAGGGSRLNRPVGGRMFDPEVRHIVTPGGGIVFV